MRRVVVTGSTGHLGANLVRALVERGDRVRALTFGDDRALDGLDVEKVPGDVRDRASLRRAFEGAELVFHLAAHISITGSQDGLVEAINVAGAANAAEAALAAGARRFVHCSSVHAFDIHREGRLDEQAPRAAASACAYDRSKLAGEREVQARVARGLDAVILNPSGILGPHDAGPSRIGRVMLDLRHGRLPALLPGGFAWIDARDLSEAFLAAADRGERGHNYLVSGPWLSMRDFAERAAKVAGVRAPRLTVPVRLARLVTPLVARMTPRGAREPLFTGESIDTVQARARIDDRKARAAFGLRPPRPIETSFEDMYRWYEAAKIS
jgi:dihydroflavonol-4-reductase